MYQKPLRKLITVFLFICATASIWAGGSSEAAESDSDNHKIRIAVMPDAGALPLLLMDEVETVPFMSARDRDAAILAGEVDGFMTDLVAVQNFNRAGYSVKVLSITESRFMILANKDFDPANTWTIGISENSVIEYMADVLAGDAELDKIAIPAVPVRMQMLGSGEIPLAGLADVMAWPLIEQGHIIQADQLGTGLEPAVLAFSGEWLDGNADRIASFVASWNAAVAKINADPESYRQMLMDQIRLPESSTYPVPVYREIVLPDQHTLDSVSSWFEKKYGEAALDFPPLLIQP